MKTLKRKHWLSCFLWLAVAGVLSLIGMQILKNRRLGAELTALREGRRAGGGPFPGNSPSNGSARTGQGDGHSIEAGATETGAALMKRLEEEMADPDKYPVERYGPRHPKMAAVNQLLDKLTPGQSLALLREDPAFLQFVVSAGKTQWPPVRAEALRARILSEAYRRLAGSDPVVALDLFKQAAALRPELLTNTTALDFMASKPLESWAAKEPLAALAWLKQLGPAAGDAERMGSLILQTMARTDPAGAWEAMVRGQVSLRSALPAMAASMKSRADIDFCMSRLSEQPESGTVIMPASASSGRVWQNWGSEGLGTAYGFACADFASRLAASENTGAAMAFVEQWAVSPADREWSGLTAVLPALAAVADARPAEAEQQHAARAEAGEAESASDWLMAFVPEERQVSTVRRLMESWVQADPARAAVWLERQPESSWRDEGLALFCRKAAVEDPVAAARWLEMIADPALRERTLLLIPRQNFSEE